MFTCYLRLTVKLVAYSLTFIEQTQSTSITELSIIALFLNSTCQERSLRRRLKSTMCKRNKVVISFSNGIKARTEQLR